jgi:hypothetical protein
MLLYHHPREETKLATKWHENLKTFMMNVSWTMELWNSFKHTVTYYSNNELPSIKANSISHNHNLLPIYNLVLQVVASQLVSLPDSNNTK